CLIRRKERKLESRRKWNKCGGPYDMRQTELMKLTFTIVIFLFILFELEIFPPTAKIQNEGWQYFRGSFYYVSTTPANWQNSRDYCTSKGADLVVINDADENQFILKQGLNRKAWIGLYRSGSTWTWVDGSILSPSVSYWGPGEPNNFGNREDRAAIGFNNNVNTWNDCPWYIGYYWICEIKVVYTYSCPGHRISV
uniref:C-type lectin domain-containing protein n=1 Tax=Oryzias latipes TaxID=8090 RepID=A0A3P9IJU5_ORYLA